MYMYQPFCYKLYKLLNLKYYMNYIYIFSNCLCGRTKDWHQAKGIATSDPQEYEERRVWHHKTHSRASHTDSFGVIQFQGFGQESSDSPVST